MLRRITLLITLLAVALVGVVPSQAAAKPKPRFRGSYDVTLPPDPTQEVLAQAGSEGCKGLTGKGTDNHVFTVPAKGTLTVTLSVTDPTNKDLTDWALWLVDKDGITIDHSDGTGPNEQTTTAFKKKQSFVIRTCNMTGDQHGHIAYLFKYA